MFDITKAAVEETAKLKLTDANGSPLTGDKGKPCSITLNGPGSTAFAQAEAARQNRLLERARKGKKEFLTADEQRIEQAEFLASVTVSFDNFGYPPAGDATGKELFKALYLDRKLGFVTDQVQRFVGDWGNFTGSSATS